MTCIGCGHLFIDGEIARCALRNAEPRSIRERLVACERHTEAQVQASSEDREPMRLDELPPLAKEIVVAVANAFAMTPADVMAPMRQGSLNQHIQRHGGTETMRRLTLAFARQAVIILLLRGGFTESQVKTFLGRSPNTRFHAAKAAEPIMRSDNRLAGLFTRLLDGKGV